MKTFSPVDQIRSFSPIDEEEEQPNTIKTFSPIEEPKRESQHLKQAAAGVLDIGAGLPALAGLIATPFKAAYHAVADDTGLKDSFVKGLDNPAMRLAGDMHEGINDLVGVEDPVGLEQLSRLAPMLIPTPASLSGLVTKGAGAASKALNITSAGGQKAMELGAQIALPMVQTTKGASLGTKAAQIGLQDAITIGADQGIRYGMGMPTIASSFSEIDDYAIENPIKTGVSVAAMIAAGVVGSNALAQRAASMEALARSTSELGVIPNNTMSELPGSITLGQKLDSQLVNTHSIVRDRVKAATGSDEIANDVFGLWSVNSASASSAVFATGTFPNSAVRVSQDVTPKSLLETFTAFSPEKQAKFNETVIAHQEKTNRITATIKSADPNAKDLSRFEAYKSKKVTNLDVYAKKLEGEIKNAEDVIASGGTTSRQQTQFIKQTRKKLEGVNRNLSFWKAFGTTEEVVGLDGKKWRILDGVGDDAPKSIFSDNVPLDEQLTFLKSIGADMVETGLVVGSKDAPFLTPVGAKPMLATTKQLNNTIKKGMEDGEVADLVKRFGKFTEGVLSYMVEQGRLDEATAGLWKRNATLDGVSAYMPGMEATAPDLGVIGRMKYVLGWNTPEADDAVRPLITKLVTGADGIVDRAKEQAVVLARQAAKESGNFEGSLAGPLNRQAYDEMTGIMNPMNPMHAIESYIASIVEHTSQNTARLRTYQELASKVTKQMIVNKELDDGEIIARYASIDPQTGKIIEGSIDKEIESAIKTRAGTNLIEDIKRESMMQVWDNGKPVLYYVPSKTLQHATTFHPNIVNGLNRIGAFTKNLYQTGTTRNIFFAIPQAFYSTMLQMVNAPAHGLLYTPLDAIRGIKESLAVGLANETADHLDRLTATIPFFQNRPFFTRYKDHLRNTVQKSLMMEIQSLTGGIAGSSMAVDSMTRVVKISDQWAGAIKMKGDGNTYGTLKGLYRYGAIINRSIQDGPLVGLLMKSMRQELKKDYNVIKRPAEIDGVKIKYGSPPKSENGKIPPAQYDRETNTITIDIDRLKRAHKSGWKSDKEAYSNIPHFFDDGDDFAEYVLQHEIAHSKQAMDASAVEGVARERQANDMASLARNSTRAKAARVANVKSKDIGGDYLAHGSDDTVRGFRAWVPFSGAAIQGMRAFGRAMAKDPKKTLAMIATAVVIPAIAEQLFVMSMASEEQKEAFWKQSDSTRASNMLIPHPDGKTFVQVPVEPIMRVFRSMTIEAIDSITNASNQYRPYKVDNADGASVETGQFGHAFFTGLQSAINLPLPPLMQAGLAASGYQGVAGVDPNSESYMGGIRPLAGQQVAAMGRDQTSMIDGVMSKNAEGVITSLTGFLGSVALSTFNQFNLGQESGFEEKLDRALGEAGTKLGTYSRTAQLFGLDESVRYTRASHLDRELRPMIRGLKAMQAIAQNAVNGGMLPGGVMPAGNAPLGPEEFEQVQVAINASALAQNPRFVEAGTKIATAFKQISVINASDRAQPDNVGMLPWLDAGEPFTREMKHRAQQELTMIINQERVMQLFMMKQHEEMTGVKYADYAGTSPPIRLDSPFAQPSGTFEEEATYTATPEISSPQ